MQRFRDLGEVRDAIKAYAPLDEIIMAIDRMCDPNGNDQLERVNDNLYKKRCSLDEHPTDTDGTKDSTASFTVCPPKELWHCFGCGTSGDRFEYAQRRLHIDHVEAIRVVAEIEGFDLSSYYAEQSDDDRLMDTLFSENNQARDMAHNALLASQDALNYLLGRGISMESITEFKIGYARPITTDRVTMFSEIPNSIALQLDRKDQFNDAILFPVCDVHGRMRYFQSRPFNPIGELKYIGARETHPLYDETDRIYGFCISRRRLRQSKGRLVGVEGAPDAIVCNQHGIPAGAFLGTAVNQKTFDLLDKNKVTELVLLLDGDKAGYDRANKIADKYMELKTNVRLKIATLPDGYDPDDFINEYGAQVLLERIDNAPYAVQFLIDMVHKSINPVTLSQRIDFMSNIKKYIIGIQDRVIRSMVVKYVASLTGIDAVEIDDYYKQNVQVDAVPLYNIDGEEILLAEAMRRPEFAAELTASFKPEDMYLSRHKALLSLLRDAKFYDVDSLYTMATNARLHEIRRDWLEYLVTKQGSVDFAFDDVMDKLIRSRSKTFAQQIMTDAHDMSRDITVSVDRSMSELYRTVFRKSTDRVFSATKQADDTMDIIHQRMGSGNRITGFPIGPRFRKLEQAWLGLNTKEFTVVAANQSVGKTQICENWVMYQSVYARIPSLWFSLEMDKLRMTFRNLSILSGVPTTPMMIGDISAGEKELIDEAALRLRQSPFFLSERGHDVSEALSIARQYVRQEGVKIIYVDYLQLQYVSNNRRAETRSRELGIISKEWKQFAQEMDVHVIGIMQLGKQAIDADVATAEMGYGSYEPAQDADNFLTLKEKTAEEIAQRGLETCGNITANVAKNRMGERSILIDMYADRPKQLFSEIATI